MSYSVDNIVQVTTKFIPGGLQFANFGFACLFVPEAELPVGFVPDTYRDYTNVADMQADGFLETTEAYLAASKWLGSDPRTYQLRVYGRDSTDPTIETSYAKARDQFWWFITLNTAGVFDDSATILSAALWCNTNEAMLCYTSDEPEVLVPGDTTSVPYQLTQLGYRYVFSTYHPTDRYASFPILNWFATVNYQVDNSTITGEYKTIGGTTAFDGTQTQYNAMKDVQVKCGWISDIDLQGETVKNRYLNAMTHSANFERIDDVFNTAAFVNAIKVSIFNVVANQPTKLGQTVAGQQAVITASQQVCEQYLANGFLGERVYINPDNGLEEFTRGYEILTKPEDILTISDSERTDRQSAPMRIRIFRAGAIEKVYVDLTIY